MGTQATLALWVALTSPQNQDCWAGLHTSKAVPHSGLPVDTVTQGSRDGEGTGAIASCTVQNCSQQPRAAGGHLKRCHVLFNIKHTQDFEDFV